MLKLVRRFHSAASIAPSTKAEQSTHRSRRVLESVGGGRSASSSTATTKRAGRCSPLRWHSSHFIQSGARVKERRFLKTVCSTRFSAARSKAKRALPLGGKKTASCISLLTDPCGGRSMPRATRYDWRKPPKPTFRWYHARRRNPALPSRNAVSTAPRMSQVPSPARASMRALQACGGLEVVRSADMCII